ncbi:hypothetical protein ACFQ0M_11685 [Kitasatospora aburaviensis]
MVLLAAEFGTAARGTGGPAAGRIPAAAALVELVHVAPCTTTT